MELQNIEEKYKELGRINNFLKLLNNQELSIIANGITLELNKVEKQNFLEMIIFYFQGRAEEIVDFLKEEYRVDNQE